MRLNGWHPFESVRFNLVMWRCLVLQIWEQQKTASTKTKSNSIMKTLHIHWPAHSLHILIHCNRTSYPQWSL